MGMNIKRFIYRNMLLIKYYIYDFNRFRRWSSAISGENTQAKMRARMILRIHSIEKGLSLEDARLGFGMDNIKLLIELFQVKKYCKVSLYKL